ncbi:hypothetical protein LCGC14_0791810 [marine sediment metagenome]|uniref:ATPase AAA-type core domain-containing protein n=1 Tax=marine sediment metagenome TaxID=412755 RepID=A0A0F9PWN4_9ZZZZ
MFVKSLIIKEFRGVKSCKKPIEFSNFTVLIGRNNSGKSAVLEALSLLPNPWISRYISSKTRIEYLTDIHSTRKGGKYRRLLYLYAGEARLDYTLENENKSIYFKITKDNYESSLIHNVKSIANFFNMNPKQLEHSVLFFPYTTSILDDLEWRMGDLKDLITKKGYHITLAKFLNECVNDNFSEFIFQEPITLRKVYPNTTAFIELKDLGAGAEKVIKIMTLLELLKPKLVLIDDFAAGFHPTMIRLFFNWLKKKDFQIIISTHNIDVLYHLTDLKPKDTSILQLNKSNEDVLCQEIFTLEEIESLLSANNDPRLLSGLLNL